MKTHYIFLPTLLAALLVSGCGGSSSGADVVANAAPVNQGPSTYNGPAPRTSDVSAFKTNVWDNMVIDGRCGNCHDNQVPAFVDRDNINNAYTAANTVVSLANPGSSRLVSKVAGGHNCWLESDAACADLIEAWITNWANASIGGEAGSVVFTAPPQRDAGSTRGWPASSGLFASNVYPILRSFCIDCHQPGSDTPISPYFAHDDVDTAYTAAQAVINLDDPQLSRVVERLIEDSHNCWTDSCANDGSTLADAIAAMADGIPLTPPADELVVSDALLLEDGTPAAGGGRFDANVIARYEFRTGSGTTAFDTSGVEPALNLSLSGDFEWVGGWGVRFSGGRGQGSTQQSAKLHSLVTSSGEFTLEAWVIPASPAQDDAHIITYSGGADVRNVTLAQMGSQYQGLLRHDNTDANGMPPIESGDDTLQATLQHVVLTYSASEGRRMYVNGVDTGALDPSEPSLLNSWSDNFALVLGNEASGDRPWQGVVRFLAVHNRALAADQITQNFEAGVGERAYLLFGISDLIDLPQSYIGFLVSRFDNYSYLFAEPFFINLDETLTDPPSVAVEGMRLGLNGREISVAQVWTNLDTDIGGSGYDAGGQPMSPLGTVIPVERGPQADEFFLTFARIGAFSNDYSWPNPIPLSLQPDEEQSDIGLRTFDEINATMSAMTGVPITHAEVQTTFNNVRQQLPVSEEAGGFLTAHQIGIAQLAIEYCNALVETELASDPTNSSYFNGLDYTVNANAISDSDWRTQVIAALLDNAVGTGLDSQPLPVDVQAELENLLLSLADNKPVDDTDGIPDGLARCGGSCPADQTQVAVKAACAAAVGGANMLLQ